MPRRNEQKQTGTGPNEAAAQHGEHDLSLAFGQCGDEASARLPKNLRDAMSTAVRPASQRESPSADEVSDCECRKNERIDSPRLPQRRFSSGCVLKVFVHRMRVATPNDPKLSDGGGWRDGCVGEGGRAAGVTAGAVRCSAWLGDVGCIAKVLPNKVDR